MKFSSISPFLGSSYKMTKKRTFSLVISHALNIFLKISILYPYLYLDYPLKKPFYVYII